MRLNLSIAWAFLALGSIAVGVGGCGGGGGDRSTLPSPEPPGPCTSAPPQTGWTVNQAACSDKVKKVTVLNYINGANDLEEYMTLNVNQMEEVGTTADVNLVVQYKRISAKTGDQDYDTSSGNWDDTRRFLIQRDSDFSNITSPVLAQRPDCDMGDYRELQNFIEWGVKAFPAERYILIIENHGAGWRSQQTRSAATPITRGLSYDDTTGNHIDTIEMPTAIDLDRVLPGHKWDVLVLDCSLMQMLEVAYEIQGKADWVVGSEESPPGRGYPYDTFLANLVRNPSMASRDFALNVIDETWATYGSNTNITQSVLELSKIPAIVPELDGLGSALMAAKTTWGNQIADARAATDRYDYPENKDLVDFCRRLTETPTGQTTPRVNDPGVINAANRVQAAVRSAVVRYYAGTNGNADSNGLAAFLPTPREYRTIDIDQANGFGQRFSRLAISRDAPNWQSFLANGPN
ncbi:MAG: clostripain-related cysteine peptidase [Armatimonas sp.]